MNDLNIHRHKLEVKKVEGDLIRGVILEGKEIGREVILHSGGQFIDPLTTVEIAASYEYPTELEGDDNELPKVAVSRFREVPEQDANQLKMGLILYKKNKAREEAKSRYKSFDEYALEKHLESKKWQREQHKK